MKKILFLLLVTISSYAQTYQNPTFGTITTKTNTEDNTATKVLVQDATGKLNWVNKTVFPLDANVVHLSGTETITGNKTFTGSVSVPIPTVSTHAVTKAYADGLIVGLLNDRGSYNASTNLFPTTGGSGTSGAILKGDIWFVSVAGTLGGKAVSVGDSFRALVNTPGQTSGNWSLLSSNLGYVPENVANKSDSYTVSSSTTYSSTKALVDGLATKQNTLTNPVTGTGTSNFISKFTGTSTIGPSLIYDSGVGISFGGSTIFGGYEFLIPTFGNNTIYLGVKDGVQNPRAFISQQSSSGNQDVHFGSAFSSGNRMANWIFESGTITIDALSGTGTRQVVADSSGNLSATDIAPTSGTYTPTLTATSNISSITLTNASYTKIGDIVTVVVGFDVSVTTASSVQGNFSITLPVNRTGTTTKYIGNGSVLRGSGATSAPVIVDSASTTLAVARLVLPNTSSHVGSVTFQYDITL